MGAFAVRPEAFRHDDLEVFLGLAGELLSLPCEGREFKLLNITECLDALDWDQSTKKVTGRAAAGYPEAFNLDSPRFHLDRLGGQLFKIPEDAHAAILLLGTEQRRSRRAVPALLRAGGPHGTPIRANLRDPAF